MRRYRVYGLSLASDRPLHGLFPAPDRAPPDVLVELEGEFGADLGLPTSPHWRRIHSSGSAATETAAWAASTATGPAFRLRYGNASEHIEFLIGPQGHRIQGRGTATVTPEDIEPFLLGPVLTCALRARGLTCLHASVVSIGDATVAFAGPAGAGKSTTAAALARLGGVPRADDLAAIFEEVGAGVDGAEEVGRFLVQQGPRRLRLRPDAADRFGPPGGSPLPRVYPDLPNRLTRRYFTPEPLAPIADAFRALPLACIYLLSEHGADQRDAVIEPLTPAAGCMQLVASAAAPFMAAEIGTVDAFDRFSRLARGVPIRVIRRRKRLASLSAIGRAILDDVDSL